MVRKRRARKYLRAWPERYAPKHLRADDILRIMRMPVDLTWYPKRDTLSEDEYALVIADWRRHWWPRKRKISREASTDALLAALKGAAVPSERAILIEILGWRDIPRIMLEFVPYINDRSYRVRDEAVDAVGKVALGARRRWGERTLSKIDTKAVGQALLSRYIKEKSLKQRNVWLPAALGAVGYRPAIPPLIASLFDRDPIIRGHAAWSLGHLRAREAVSPLRHAYAKETDSFAKDRIWVALYETQEGREWRLSQRGKS
jgi:hypothetical protein